MANVDLVDLIPILKAINSIKNQYKDAIETVETDFSLYPVLTQNFLDKSYNNGYIVGFRQCLTDYLGTSDGVEIDSPRSMREVVPATYESQSGDATYDTLTSIMNFCLQIRRNLKEILDLDTDLFELYPPQVLTLAQSQYVAGYNDGYLGAISYVEGLAVLPPTINSGNNIVTLTSPQENVPTLEMFYKKGSLDGEWIQYYKGDVIQILESESPVRIYAYARIGSKNSSIASRIVDYNDFMMPTIEFSNNTITIYPNYGSDSPVKTKYKLSSWSGYNDFLDYDGLPIPITSQVTVWAYNYLGEQQSETASRTCTPSESSVTRPASPTITFSSQNNVLTVSTTTPGCTLYYQKAGSGDGWVPYYGPVILAESGTYTAIAVKDGVESLPSENVVCSVSTSGGGVTPAQPVCVAPTVVCNNNKISVITSQSGVKLYLSNQGRTNYGSPDYDPANEMAVGEWYEYTGQVPISESGKYQAKAVLIADPSKYAYSVVTDCTYFAADPGSGSIPGGGSGSSTDEYVAPPLMSCNDSILTLSPVTVGSTVYYRENGTDTWLLYTEPITILSDWTYEAKAVKNGFESSVASLQCLTQIPVAPTISCTNDGRVTMTTPSIGATILYKMQSDTGWTTYTQPFNITETTTFEAKAVRNGYESSVVTQECEVESTLVTISFFQNLLSISTEIDNYDSIQYKKNRDSSWITYNGPTLFDETTLYDARVVRYGSELAITTKECVYVAPVNISFTNNSVTLTTSEVGGTIKYKKNTDSSWSTYSNSFFVLETTVYEAKTVKNGYESNVTSLRCVPTSEIDYSEEYFTIELTDSSAYITVVDYNSNGDTPLQNPPTIYYSTDNENWNLLEDNILFNFGDSIRLKSTSAWTGGYNIRVRNELNENVKFIAYGNIRSIIIGDDFVDGIFTSLSQPPIDPIYGWNGFYGLFANSKITSAKNLILPATTLHSFSYDQMFSNCKDLVEAPVLPATTLGERCYEGMFYGCTSLITAPALPATVLAKSCYSQMFEGCTSLITAPALPATTLSPYCYNAMFMDCTSLVSSTNLPATILEDGCYQYMFYNCTSFISALVLNAPTLVQTCYKSMFNNTRITSITCLATNISAYDCLKYWMQSVPASGTFTKAAGVTWPRNSSGIPSGWTIRES